MYKENFQITDKKTGKDYWISRSIAVTAIVVCTDEEGMPYFLAEKRGPGCPDNVGKWCCPCGYLGWGETRREAVTREIFEETGLDYRGVEDGLYEWMTMDDPGDNERQNVTTRYVLPADYDELSSYDFSLDSKSRGGEDAEVDELKLIRADEIDNYEWAWNHGELLKQFLEEVSKTEN